MAVSVRLEPMSESRFAAWAGDSQRGFRRQLARAGVMPAKDAGAYAAEEFVKLLPQGPGTPGQHHWVACDGAREVGTLWVGIAGGGDAYLYDFTVASDVRRRGYGSAMMSAVEGEVRRRGARTMRLTVFGHNGSAFRLYDRRGFCVLATALGRRLRSGAPCPAPGQPEVTLVLDERSAPGALGWTAYDGDRRVGRVRVQVVPRSDGEHALCEDLTVEPSLRGRGYGAALIAAAGRACRARGAVAVEVDVPGTAPGLRALYERSGYAVTATLMHKDL